MTPHLSFWRQLAATPHRGMFLAGSIQGVLVMLWWGLALLARSYPDIGLPLWSAGSSWAHPFWMIYGFFPFFMFGFLFTTYPNWMNAAKIPSRRALFSAGLLSTGVVLCYVGLAMAEWVLIAGLVFMLMGWSLATFQLLHVLLTARHPDKRHPIITSAALIAGGVGLAATALWRLTGNGEWLAFSRVAGIWFFLLPIMMTVSHRMIPFFSSRVIKSYIVVRPYGLLWLMLACSVAQGVLTLFHADTLLWAVDFVLAVCALYFTWAWRITESFQVALLAVLHTAFAWLGLSMLLFGLQNLALVLRWNGLHFGLAPLHALTIGFMTSLLMGMASRVTLGHAGRPLKLDRFTIGLFVGIQFTAVIRVLADMMPDWQHDAVYGYVLAAGIWLMVWVLWATRYAPMYWRARADGKAD
ncbi:MAG: NnrS family protein [Betaproteobacteria bacterium]|nr:NnrS family protein [Betaproteobacteria bacterium]